jgi:hypothetical protein
MYHVPQKGNKMLAKIIVVIAPVIAMMTKNIISFGSKAVDKPNISELLLPNSFELRL